MKRNRMFTLLWLAGAFLLLCACARAAKPEFTDTLPCNAEDGYTWLVYESADSIGHIDTEQTYREDETYAMLGAPGVLENVFRGVSPGLVTVRLYYVHAEDWDGLRSSAHGAAYYEFQVYDDLSIRLLYSEVEFPDRF